MNPRSAGHRAPWRLLSAALAVGVVLFLVPDPSRAAELDRDLVEPALTEDWAGIAARVARSTSTRGPVAQALLGHATLALNRNNESVCLLRAIADPATLQEWQDWTRELAAQHPQSTTAHYLVGDALARLRRAEEARHAFDRALTLNPRHALTLNARGVLLAGLGRYDQALRDFDLANEANANLADAFASRGTLWIQRRNGAPGAFRALDRAVTLSPDFALALNSRGGLHALFGRFDEAAHDLSRAASVACVADVVEQNLTALNELASGEELRRQLAQATEGDVGTTVDRTLRRLFDQPSQRSYNAFVSASRESPGETAAARAKLEQLARANPVWGQRVQDFANRGVTWNSGLARLFENVTSAVSARIGGEISPRPGTKVRTDVTIDPSRWAAGQRPITQANLQQHLGVERALSGGLGPRDAGGVKQNLGDAFVDEGDWPLRVQYGLFYPPVLPHAATSPEESKP